MPVARSPQAASGEPWPEPIPGLAKSGLSLTWTRVTRGNDSARRVFQPKINPRPT